MKRNTIFMLAITGGLPVASMLYVIVAMNILRQPRPQLVTDGASGYASTVDPDSHRLTNPAASEIEFECEARALAYTYVNALESSGS